MILTLEHVSKRYPGPEIVHAVRDVSLTVEPRDVIVLLGPSGSGKSTLLMLAAGVLRPDDGRVLVDGKDLAGMSKKQVAERLRTSVGVAFQDPQLIAGHHALDNAAIKLLGGGVRLRDAQRRARPWLAKMGLGDRLYHEPHQLSGGEKQRVGLAQALVGDPSLLLLDEPTAGLDSIRGSEILDLVENIASEGIAVVLATHDLSATRIATRTIELHDGQLVKCRQDRAA